MPADTDLSEDVIAQYDAARVVLANALDPRAVPLLLHSFGDGDGFGVYQLVDDTLRTYPREWVIAGLADALGSPIRSVRSWCMDLALEYPDPRLAPQAVEVLQSDDPGARYFAAVFLGFLDGRDAGVEAALARALELETEDDVRSAIGEALAGSGPSDIPRR